MPLRIKRLMARLETDDADMARREIRIDDAARAARMAEHFDVDWGDPALYDLTLNTERLSIPTCVDMVLKSAASAEFAESPASRQRLLDLALAARVRAALRADDATSGVDIAADVANGVLVLSGIVTDARERDLCGELAGKVPGVTTLDNCLAVMKGTMGARLFPSGLAR